MTTLLPIHITAGLISLVAGAVALYARKGDKRHRQSGRLFVYAMLVMSSSGAMMAAIQLSQKFVALTAVSVLAGVLTFYLVSTALLTVWRPATGFRWIDLGALLVALAVGITGIALGLGAVNGVPAASSDGAATSVGFLFGTVALLAVFGDLRMMLAGGLQGAQRIARHLWRMCFALWIATASFFLGQPQLFSEPLRNSGLLAIPPLAVLLLMVYWWVRVRFTRWYRLAYP